MANILLKEEKIVQPLSAQFPRIVFLSGNQMFVIVQLLSAQNTLEGKTKLSQEKQEEYSS